jgi:cobalt-zinc-cadmium efflux system membrane fusion protein
MNTRAILLSCVLGLVGVGGCGRGNEASNHGAQEEHADEHGSSDRVTLPAGVAQEVGIKTAAITAGTIRDAHEVQGLLTPVEGKHARVRARFPGVIRSIAVGVGDQVKAGQTLAIVESNTSLMNYVVKAPFAGTILDRSASAGDLAGDEALFELADLSTLWVDLHLFGADAQHITPSLPVEVIRMSDQAVAMTKLERILPGTATASQSTIARATIRNDDGRWRPGTAVRARVTVSERAADRVVPLSAIQTLEGQSVVFVRSGDTYIAKPIRLGDRDAEHAELLDGAELGEEIVVEQSYLIKADIEKAGAAHED